MLDTKAHNRVLANNGSVAALVRSGTAKSSRSQRRKSHGILWLASYPKSGNTWVRAFLANYMRGSKAPVPINMLPFYCLGDNFRIHYEQLSGKPGWMLSTAEVESLRSKVHGWFASCRGETALVKTHSLFANLNGVPLITSEATAGFIYIVRNPLDIVASYAQHYQISLDQAVSAITRDNNILPSSDKLLPQTIGSWSQHTDSWMMKKSFPHITLRYEDLIAKPKASFARLIRFMGLPFDAQRLSAAIANAGFDCLSGLEVSDGFVEARPGGNVRFFRQGQKGRWRDELDKYHVDAILNHSAPSMQGLGYLSPDGDIR